MRGTGVSPSPRKIITRPSAPGCSARSSTIDRSPDRGGSEGLRAQGQVVGDDVDDLVVIEVGLPGQMLLVLLPGLLRLRLRVFLLVGIIVGDEVGAELLLVEGDRVPGLALDE